MDTLQRQRRRLEAELALAKNRLAFAHALLSDQPIGSPLAELVERELLQSIAEDKVKTLAGHSDAVESVCAVGGMLASGSADNTVKLWDVGSGTYVWSVCEVGGMLASGSGDNTVKLWDVGSGTCVKTLAGHTGCVQSVCAVGGMPAGRPTTRLSSGTSARARASRHSQGTAMKFGPCASRHSQGTAVVFSPCARSAGCSPAGRCVKTLAGHTGCKSAGSLSAGKIAGIDYNVLKNDQVDLLITTFYGERNADGDVTKRGGEGC